VCLVFCASCQLVYLDPEDLHIAVKADVLLLRSEVFAAVARLQACTALQCVWHRLAHCAYGRMCMLGDCFIVCFACMSMNACLAPGLAVIANH
jgi:hypothetical protein